MFELLFNYAITLKLLECCHLNSQTYCQNNSILIWPIKLIAEMPNKYEKYFKVIKLLRNKLKVNVLTIKYSKLFSLS